MTSGPENFSGVSSPAEMTAETDEILLGEESKKSAEPILESASKFLTEEEVQTAVNIDDLIKKVSSVDKVEGVKEEGEYDSAYVVKKITEFRDFLMENMESLQLSVITERKDGRNDELMRKLVYVPLGLGLRQKVKDLMKEAWDKSFAEKRNEITEKAIAGAGSVKELNEIISKFKTIKEVDEVDSHEPSEVVDGINNVLQILNKRVLADEWQTVEVEKIVTEIEKALSLQKIPKRYGIYDKAQQLLFTETSQLIKDKRLADHSSSLSQPSSIGGWFKKKLGGWFGQRKK